MNTVDGSSLYKRWESLTDLSTFSAVQFFSLMAREVSIMHPHALGALTVSASHALSIAASKKVLKADSPALHIAGTVMGLAISTIALPYILTKCAVHTVLRLSFETALRSALTCLAVKTAAYGLYWMGSEAIDRYRWEIPKQLKDLDSLQSTQLSHVKAFFMGHTDERKGLTLSLQYALGLTLGECAGIGDGWTREMLLAIRGEDLAFLTTVQQKELNQLFMEHDFLPHKRPYKKDELPTLPKSLDALSKQQLSWVHLILQLSEAAIPPKLAKQFFKHGFTPARNEWIELTSPIDLDLLEPFELSWVGNYYIAHPEKWKELDFEKQQTFKSKCPIPLPVHPKTEEEVKKLTKKDLKEYATAFEIDDFSLEMRRVFASHIEEELGASVDHLFRKGEERVAPNYLFGRVTKTQALAVGIIIMVVAVPAIAGLATLFGGSSQPIVPNNQGTSGDKADPTVDILPLSSDKMTFPHFEQESVSIASNMTEPILQEGFSLPKVDRCPDNNCLTVPVGSQVVDHPVEQPPELEKTGEVILPFLQQHRNMTKSVVQEGFCHANDWFVSIHQGSSETQIVEEVALPKVNICPDKNCLTVPVGSQVVDHPVELPRKLALSEIQVIDRFEQFPEVLKIDKAFHLYVEQESGIITTNATNATMEATPQFPIEFKLPQPYKYLVTPIKESQPFSLVTDHYPHVVPFPIIPGNSRVSQPSYTFLGTGLLLSVLVLLGLYNKRAQSKDSSHFLGGREVAVHHPLPVFDVQKDADAVKDAKKVGLNIEIGGECFQFLFDLSTKAGQRQFYQLFRQAPVLMIGNSSSINPLMEAQVAFMGIDGLPQFFQLDMSNHHLAGLLSTLTNQARAGILQPQGSGLKGLSVKKMLTLPLHSHSMELPMVSIPRRLPYHLEDNIEGVNSEKRITPNWRAFEEYVRTHCFGMDPRIAMMKASNGLILIQKLHRGDPVERKNLEEQLSDACWGLMLHAITKNQAFVEGTFDLTDPGHRFFHFFEPILYGRSSSHYKKRVIEFDSGTWKGYAHFGLDIYRNGENDLPASKRTVMLGRIATRDGSPRTYLKMENWGANLNFWADPRALSNAHQVLFHTFEFFESQAKRNLPGIFGEVGGGLHMHKEHMLSADKKQCRVLYEAICKVLQIPDRFDIDEYGFQDVVPLLRMALHEPKIQAMEDLYSKIEGFLGKLEQRYDNLEYRKGDEVNMNASILMMDPVPMREEMKVKEIDIEDEFEFVESESSSGPADWEIAREKLLSTDYLANHTVITYANALQKQQPFAFVDNMLFVGLVERELEKQSFLLSKLGEALQKGEDLIFIPLILESSPTSYLKSIPGLGRLASYCPDHIVLLAIDCRNKTFEYYNSQGGQLKDETRHVLGFNVPLPSVGAKICDFYESRLGKLNQKFNPHPVQRDWSNCGAFLCRFMNLRSSHTFDEICTDEGVNIQKERVLMAEALKRRHDPDPLSQAASPEDVYAYLENQHLRMYRDGAQQVLLDNVQPYIQQSKVNQVAIFKQINMDLVRDGGGIKRFILGETTLDGTLDKDADYIYKTLMKKAKSSEEVLSWMSLLQQGIFAGIQMNILKDLEIADPESGFQIRGHGEYVVQRQKKVQGAIHEYHIDISKGKPVITASAYYELISNDTERGAIYRERPYGVLKATVTVDLNTNQAVSSWAVDEVVKN